MTKPKAPEDKVKTGRKPVYKREFIAIAAKMCAAGAINKDLAERFGVNVGTIYRWMVEHPEFREAVKLNKDKADERVEEALYSLAIEDRHPTALIFILKNRRPQQWRDAHVIQHELPTAREVAEAMGKIDNEL